MDTVAVLIPCFNEALTIKKVVEDFKQVTVFWWDSGISCVALCYLFCPCIY